MEIVSEPVKRIDSGFHVELRRELKQWLFGGAPLYRWHDAVEHPVNVILLLLERSTINFFWEHLCKIVEKLILSEVLIFCEGAMALDPWLSGQSSSPGWGHCVVLLTLVNISVETQAMCLAQLVVSCMNTLLDLSSSESTSVLWKQGLDAISNSATEEHGMPYFNQ